MTAEVPGVPQWVIKLVGGHRKRTSCNSDAELSGHPESLFKGDDTAVCHLRRLTLSKGTILFDTFCTNRHFPAGLLVSSQGTYTPTSYAISTISTGTRNGKPVRIVTQGSGTLVSATCAKP